MKYVMEIMIPLALLLWAILGGSSGSSSNDTSGDSLQAVIEQSERGALPSLSRRKRYLIFPEGSSLQLVYCLTPFMVINIGDIFYFGLTAALAWELPQDPYSPFDHHGDPLHRSDDPKNIYYTNEKGKVFKVTPARRKTIVNPAFAKRSIEDDILNGGNGKENPKLFKENEVKYSKEYRKNMHEAQQDRHYLKQEYMSSRSIEFHRTSRRDLYPKIEAFLKTMGHDGRACVLRLLCEAGRAPREQGAFLHEIFRTIFTLPKGDEFAKDTHRAYDHAHAHPDADTDCHELFPGCELPTQDIEDASTTTENVQR